jgi:hypothetical protein
MFVLAAVAALVAVFAAVGALLDHSWAASSGVVVFLILAGAFVSLGRVALRGRVQHAVPASSSSAQPEQRWAAAPTPPTGMQTTEPPINDSVRYLERFSQLPVRRTVIAFVLLGAGIAIIAAVGGSSQPGLQGFLFILPAGPFIYLIAVLLYLPYGIEIADGRLRLGVRGVPRLARVWRREDIPLEAVIGWHVGPVSPTPANASNRRRSSSAPRSKSTGDLRGPGVRSVLTVQLDPTLHNVRFPAKVMYGYVPAKAASLGYVNDGTLRIGTRHPRRLEAILNEALPGRLR